jgi:hypothetical protein
MDPIIVSTQTEYNEAKNLCQNSFDKSYFDIDKDIGMDIVAEVDFLIYHYLCREATKEETERSLSHFYFNQEKASEITSYFLTHRPGDLYDIERGLNMLNLRPDGNINDYEALIHIKNSVEKIRVNYPVEVFGESEIEVFGQTKIVAYDNAQITAHDHSIVEAYNQANVTALDQSHITARNNCAVYLYNQSTATAYDHVSVTASNESRISLFNLAEASVFNFSFADSYDESIVTGKDSAKIRAYNKSKIYAYNQAHVTAKDLSHTVAGGQASVIAEDNSIVLAGDEAKVTARHRSIVFARDNADCSSADKAMIISKAQNKPLLLESNVLHILDHPNINLDPALAANLLISAANPEDKAAFDRKLKAMGCVDPQSTNRVLNSLVREFEQRLYKKQGQNSSWEW